ncbi:signal transduction histidine kinase [Catenuloplanes nepalensis]|uniref:histidine kinase n=1 Tax=Catenuloplanes nepalensis TaxID=587533 RepID=A0ABT9N5R6_9ACTN|nr:histidine kinase [Catenuloplanes nepalensis]MDP9799043.1 signal transduction histidine kinase [Catenuloplanes nepalensis]
MVATSLLDALDAPDEDDPVRPRTTRDWAVDSLTFVFAIGFAIAVTAQEFYGWGTPERIGRGPAWLLWLDLALSLVLCVALWWRRRRPVSLALLGVLFGVFSAASGGATLTILFSVAVHRRFPVAAALTAINVAPTLIYAWLRPDPAIGYWATIAWTTVFASIILLWGSLIRSRRQLVRSLRDRAERAEAEQQLRVTQARQLERTRIAREMHDVLAHRISLLSLHAGALEIRPDAPAAEVARAAGVIRASAHQALQDLREVIGVLREPAADGGPERPQPTLTDLNTLVEESRAAGARVTLELPDGAESPPDAVGRTAYRMVQEGLTNARKHAPGALVTVSVAGAPGSGLTIRVRNPGPITVGAPVLPGAGTGLVGLAERATLAGGRLDHRREPGGGFTLEAWLPWPKT